MDAVFIARMERILWLYSLPYDPLFPVLCYDEEAVFSDWRSGHRLSDESRTSGA